MKITVIICLTAILITQIVCCTFYRLRIDEYKVQIEAASKLLKPSIEIVPGDPLLRDLDLGGGGTHL